MECWMEWLGCKCVQNSKMLEKIKERLDQHDKVLNKHLDSIGALDASNKFLETAYSEIVANAKWVNHIGSMSHQIEQLNKKFEANRTQTTEIEQILINKDKEKQELMGISDERFNKLWSHVMNNDWHESMQMLSIRLESTEKQVTLLEDQIGEIDAEIAMLGCEPQDWIEAEVIEKKKKDTDVKKRARKQ